MTMFDAPEPTQSIGERSSTTVPTQALAMMNSPFVRQQAEKLAQRDSPDGGRAARRRRSTGLSQSPSAGGRLPSSRAQCWPSSNEQTAGYGETPQALDRALVEFCQVLLCLNEFVYVD